MKRYPFVFFLFIACSGSNSFKRILTTNQDRDYWLRKTVDTDGRYSFMRGTFQFYKNGQVIYYVTDDEYKKGNPLISVEDGTPPSTWSFNSKDSTFRISDGLIYKVTRYSKDTILMEGKGYKGRFALIRHRGAS